MHACGHDVHMTAWIGTARCSRSRKDRWHGTLVFIGQPAEERHRGRADDARGRALQRFPKPDYRPRAPRPRRAPAGHGRRRARATLWRTSTRSTSSIHGRAATARRRRPTVDPIVIAARIVLALQTIVAREMNPLEPGRRHRRLDPRRHQAQHHPRRGEAAAHRAHVQDRGPRALARRDRAHRQGRSAAARAPKEPLHGRREHRRPTTTPRYRADRGDAPPTSGTPTSSTAAARWPPRTSASTAWRESRRSSGAWAPAIPRSSRLRSGRQAAPLPPLQPLRPRPRPDDRDRGGGGGGRVDGSAGEAVRELPRSSPGARFDRIQSRYFTCTLDPESGNPQILAEDSCKMLELDA